MPGGAAALPPHTAPPPRPPALGCPCLGPRCSTCLLNRTVLLAVPWTTAASSRCQRWVPLPGPRQAPRAGWQAQHLVARDAPSGRLLGAVPLYLKAHSYGEYVFDSAWAQAADMMGVR